MKVLLVESDFIRSVGGEQEFLQKPSAPALGVNYLASLLHKIDCETIVLDTLYEYLRTTYTNPVNVIEGTKTILENEGDIDCVGISITSPTRNYALKIAEAVKTFNPEIKVIGGGPHVTILREKFLERFSHLFDFLIVGEGDRTLPELIKTLREKRSVSRIAGLIYKDKAGKVITNPSRPYLTENELNDVSSVPFVNYDQYQKILPESVVPTANLTGSRGCAFHCAFCYSPRLWKGYRTQSADRVRAEIEYLVAKYRIKNLRFQDDVLTYEKQRAINIFEGIKSMRVGLNLYMHTRFDCIDEDILESFKEAGGKDIYFGLESGSPRIRSAMNKQLNISNQRIVEIGRTVKSFGVNLGLWVIFGYPGETEKDIAITRDLIDRVNPTEVRCNPAHVHPYTHLFRIAERWGIYKLEDWLESKDDFFPFSKGHEGRTAFETGKILESIYSGVSAGLRTPLEKDMETTLGE